MSHDYFLSLVALLNMFLYKFSPFFTLYIFLLLYYKLYFYFYTEHFYIAVDLMTKILLIFLWYLYFKICQLFLDIFDNLDKPKLSKITFQQYLIYLQQYFVFFPLEEEEKYVCAYIYLKRKESLWTVFIITVSQNAT